MGSDKDLGEAVCYSTYPSRTLWGENIISDPRCRLAGPIEGFCGFLLIGLSTVFLVTVIDRPGVLGSLTHVGEAPEPPARDNLQP